ncbi:MAG: hypothetical protein IPJ61_19665 [Tessaracoccus sp.]|uniref:esterase/lipase family protein n=1 Tax=Tessaracoccus sp. TaxID=1971211 RepID=UPI001ECFA653|nr:hypothetical protein [Tessaracoccus sp.]MBK7823205.1 hypothetical protein [Tessaracoccus sp.]
MALEITRDRPSVVLLHGLARSPRAMHGLADALGAAGYVPHLIRYSTLAASPQAAAAAVQAQLQDTFGTRPIFAVTHSLGGVLIRYLRKPLTWKRIVMLAPPNQGSAIARAVRTTVGSDVFARLPAAAQLSTGRPTDWPYPPAPFAIIAGTRRPGVWHPAGWLGRLFLPTHEPSDGTVLVRETRLSGAAAFATVDATHTAIMDHPEAQRLAIAFLRDGAFPAP